MNNIADSIIEALDKEIQWCEQHEGHLSDEQRKWFINGLIQARLIAKKVKKAINESTGNS